MRPATGESDDAAVLPGAPVTVFEAGTHGYHTFRIPAMVRARDGALLAFAEGRRDGPGDAGAIDIVLRRSDDGGLTWSALQLVVSDGGHTVGNPSPVVDPHTGDVVLLTTRAGASATEERVLHGEVDDDNTRRVRAQRSLDNGLRWTAPVDITGQAKHPRWRWYATGPGHAIALRHGEYAGRLVVPANHSDPDTGYGGHLLLSDDGGRSWRIGAVDAGLDGAVKPNETTAAELPDGRLYLNTRNQGGSAPETRAHTLSGTGGESFDQPYAPARQLVAPVVQCSVLAVEGLLVFAGPGDPARRHRMTVRTSDDHGQTWGRELVVGTGPAAYSDLVDLDGPAIGLLHETGRESTYERIDFVRLPRLP
ncbi:sialidase family protein [Actinopolymorpha alba]|uniref:sialidase family protein n=1 Tax=Actinopolymorpha alba TaxID=533267 RepID=UPI0003A4E745|nr:sialidase family protein [Actinopolymorpha alba]